MGRQEHLFEQAVKRQTKAAEDLIKAAENVGCELTYQDLYNRVQKYKDKVIEEMLENRLKQATPLEIIAYYEAVERLLDQKPQELNSSEQEPEDTEDKKPILKKKRKRRTKAEMEAARANDSMPVSGDDADQAAPF